ncbi:MAG: DUF4416 family protein [Spirochaetia bacterium]
MGTAGTFTPEKLVMGVLSSLPGSDDELRAMLVEQWGDLDFRCPPIPFTFTDYYEKEMGGAIVRTFVSFERLVDPSCLAQVKLRTNVIEVPLADGIYAEITLLYSKGSFRALGWTYPDFRSSVYLDVLNEIRSLYKVQLRSA